jgi:hypothetical protein
MGEFPFSHGAFFSLDQGKPWLLASYHPSRQNTQTGRLTEAMFDEIWSRCRDLLDSRPAREAKTGKPFTHTRDTHNQAQDDQQTQNQGHENISTQ